MISIETNAVRHNEFTLDDFVQQMKKGRFSIPKFQRPLVWKRDDIANLGDSIIRGYPISNLLLMPKNGALQVVDLPIPKLHISDNDSEVQLILDGQQRTTAIAQIFMNDGSGKAWYFDMLAMINECFPEDGLMDLASTKEFFTIPLDAEELLCSHRAAGSARNTPHESMEHGRFIWAGAAIKSFNSLVHDFIHKGLNAFNEISEEDCRKYMDFLGAILNRLRSYSICSTQIHEDSDLKTITAIFRKINTKGKPLSVADLLAAKNFGEGPRPGEGLTEFFVRELSEWTAEDGPLKTAVYELFKIESEKDLKAQQRATSILYMCDLLQEANNSWKWRTNPMLDKPASFWYDSWDKYKADLRRILEWVGTEDLYKTCPVEALQHAIAILLVSPGAFDSREFRHALKIHMIKLALNGSTINKNDGDDILRIHRFARRIHESSYHEAKLTHSLPHVLINPEVISPTGLRRTNGKGRSKRVDCFLHLMYHTQMHNFTTDLTGNKIYYDRYHDLDKHHFFPKSKFAHISGVNSIVNFVKIDSRTNRHDFGDRRPSDYLRELMRDVPTITGSLKDNLIPLEAALADDVEGFLDQRAEMLSDYFTRVLAA